MGSMPQLDISMYSSQVFWFLISFTLLYYSFKCKFIPKLKDTLSDRSDSSEKNLKEAELSMELLRKELARQIASVHKAQEQSLKIKEDASLFVSNGISSIKTDMHSEVSEMSTLVRETLDDNKKQNIEIAKASALSIVKVYYKGLLGAKLPDENKAILAVENVLLELYVNE